MARPLLCLALLCTSLAFTTCAGIRLELTHVDAKEHYTVEERVRRATERTHRRLASMGGVTAPIHWGGQSQYIAEYLIGDPPQRAEAIIDTGSNLIWTQCSRCRPTCFRQNLPYYDPSRSRAARAVGCNDAACALGSETQCLSDNKTCAVVTGYGAGNIAGTLATENLTFQSETASLVFGCIVVTKLSPGSLNGASGIIGLGRGKLSLPSQLGDTRFSYCLTPYFEDTIEPSHMVVGASAGLINGSASSTPVTTVPFVRSPSDDPFSTFYYLPLTGITAGKVKLAVPSAAFDLRQVAPGMWTGTFIDSGAPLTSLVDVAYQALRAELARQLGTALVQPLAGTTGFDLCVALKDADRLVPPLVLHFGGGSGTGTDLVVPPANYWAPVDSATECMVVFSSVDRKSLPMNETTIIGNYMQQNMHVLYDLAGGVLSFQPADCSSI
ncbi:Aspartic proteinase nepenthesin-1 [Zea mays]|uniref:Aspartic proteinase nepenthesin-1 n=1 Tax=Zea mays TaxID=4577 RepID=A0A3L6FLU0_MAIZE|nr:Aspartic proteinase nepenthesin-1 [Zea mays]